MQRTTVALILNPEVLIQFFLSLRWDWEPSIRARSVPRGFVAGDPSLAGREWTRQQHGGSVIASPGESSQFTYGNAPPGASSCQHSLYWHKADEQWSVAPSTNISSSPSSSQWPNVTVSQCRHPVLSHLNLEQRHKTNLRLINHLLSYWQENVYFSMTMVSSCVSTQNIYITSLNNPCCF